MSAKQRFHSFIAVLIAIILLAILATVAIRTGKDATVYLATMASLTTLAASFRPRASEKGEEA